MTDFGLKNCVFDLKTLSRPCSFTFGSLDFKLEHNMLHHDRWCFYWLAEGGGVSSRMADFWIKTAILSTKLGSLDVF